MIESDKIFCAECGVEKTSKFCDRCKKETPNLFKKNFEVKIQPKPSLEKQIKRGETSWNWFWFIFVSLISIFSFIIDILPILWSWKIFIFVIITAFLFWLCILNTKFQNKLAGFKMKLEETWRKI